MFFCSNMLIDSVFVWELKMYWGVINYNSVKFLEIFSIEEIIVLILGFDEERFFFFLI